MRFSTLMVFLLAAVANADTLRKNQFSTEQPSAVLNPELGYAVQPRVMRLIEVDNENDGSTWCDYYDCKGDNCDYLTHVCFSDWDGQDCNGDDKED